MLFDYFFTYLHYFFKEQNKERYNDNLILMHIIMLIDDWILFGAR